MNIKRYITHCARRRMFMQRESTRRTNEIRPGRTSVGNSVAMKVMPRIRYQPELPINREIVRDDRKRNN